MIMSNLFNPDHLRSLASKYGLDPSKKYGQNFLIDENVIQRILETAAVTKEDTVVEVGPGFGVLTLPLASAAGRLVTFEIEKKLAPYWESKLVDFKNLEIIWGNVLKQFSNFQILNYKVVANLPYQITSAVIRMFLEAEVPPKEMVLMVQKEVGERICAKPGDMSLLSVAVQYYAQANYEFTVSKAAFWPSPQVDSAVISIRPKQNVKNDEFFFKLVRVGFANRRKLLVKNLESVVSRENKKKLREVFDLLHFLPTVRAQELSVDDWKNLVERLGPLS